MDKTEGKHKELVRIHLSKIRNQLLYFVNFCRWQDKKSGQMKFFGLVKFFG